MDWKICAADDIKQLAKLNRLLHEDEGAVPMELEEVENRLTRWIASEYTAVLFSERDQTVAYTLYRPTDRDSEGLHPGIFIRQFFVCRDQRREGIGREAFRILCAQIWPKGCGILLDTEFENHRAQRFWRSVGFSEYHLSFIRQPSD